MQAREGEKDKEKDEEFVKENVLESDFEPLCDGTTRRRSLEAQMIIITSKCNQNYKPTKMQTTNK